MKVGHDVIDRSAEEGTRLIALALLDAADEAASRVSSGADSEALHDFRVALRRLRTALRAFRPWVGEAVGSRLEKRLKRCARATNAARDTEVQLAWLDATAPSLTERQRLGAALLRERLHAREEDAAPVSRTLERWGRASAKLARRLETYERTVDSVGGGASPSFGGVLAALARDQLETTLGKIVAVEDALDHDRIHRARIEAKRLRYLLEPLRGNRHADAHDTIEHLKKLQDLLGQLHDTHVLAEQVLHAVQESARERARRLHRAVYEHGTPDATLRGSLREAPRAGLVAIDRMLRERRGALFAAFEQEWRAGGFDILVAEVQAIVGALESRAGGTLERERRYLLTAMPPHAAEIDPVEIVQGWLPGARLRERIRRVTRSGKDRYWRGLKQGAGRVRLDAEEETTREVFETLWPLTEGRRVTKTRRKLKDAGLAWNIDDYVERGFVLAEIKLPAGRTDVSFPDWLRPLVAREVTDDPEFQNEALFSVTRVEPVTEPTVPRDPDDVVPEPGTSHEPHT